MKKKNSSDLGHYFFRPLTLKFLQCVQLHPAVALYGWFAAGKAELWCLVYVLHTLGLVGLEGVLVVVRGVDILAEWARKSSPTRCCPKDEGS